MILYTSHASTPWDDLREHVSVVPGLSESTLEYLFCFDVFVFISCAVNNCRNMLQDALELANAAKMKDGVPRTERKVTQR